MASLRVLKAAGRRPLIFMDAAPFDAPPFDAPAFDAAEGAGCRRRRFCRQQFSPLLPGLR
jgi:hypothetical protein